MKKNLTTILATILLLSITSCISEPISPPSDNDGERTVALRIADSPDPHGTRNTAPIPSGTPLLLNTGNIYLVNADGIIVSHFAIVPADNSVTTLTAENLAAGIIHRNLLNTGVMLLNVPGSVTEVVIIGNTPNSNHTGNVDGEFIGGRLLNIITQHNAENVNLFGRRALPPTPTTTNDLTYFPVSVHLSPTVARFELPSITGMGLIQEFTVEGIFINNYHQQASIGGFIPTINSAPNLRLHEEASAFVYNAPGTSYTTASNNALFYWNTGGNSFHVENNGLTVRPSAQRTNVFHPNLNGGSYVMRDHVWGFQLFARNYGETTTPETEAPRLVIRLNNIRLTDGSEINEPRFVNVGGLYRRQNNAFVPVTHIRAANVYHIVHGIVFDESDLAIEPGENEINVEVTVMLAVWDGEDLYQRLRQPNPPFVFRINYGTGGTLTLGAAHPAVGVTYQWQRLVDDVWTDIDGATGLNLIIPPGSLNVPAYFRRAATLGNETHYSNAVWVYDAEAETFAVIGGIRWATRNVNYPGTFAAYPHVAGRFFQWGTLGGVPHHWPVTGGISGWNNSNDRVAWTAANDPCPAGWRMPTEAELTALYNASSTWYANWNGTGVAGRVFPAGATPEQITAAYPVAIFLPAPGWRYSSTGVQDRTNTLGIYWSSTVSNIYTTHSWNLWFNNNASGVYYNGRASGMSVRCVRDI